MKINLFWESKTVKVALLLLVVLLIWYNPIGEKAAIYVDIGLKRSLVSFATARALDGVISVLQGTEVVLQPLGVGITLTLGEILDPISELVKAFSSVMLITTVAFGVQKLLLVIGSNWLVSAFVTGVTLIWSILFLTGRVPSWVSQLLAILIFVRFVMPVAMIGSGYVFEHFSAKEYQDSQSALNITLGSLAGLSSDVNSSLAKEESQPQTPLERQARASDAVRGDDVAVSGQIKDVLSKTVEAGKATVRRAKNAVGSVLSDPTVVFRAKYEGVKNVAEQAAERIIRIIVIFLMQTIVMPLILFWGLYRLSGVLLLTNNRRSPTKAMG